MGAERVREEDWAPADYAGDLALASDGAWTKVRPPGGLQLPGAAARQEALDGEVDDHALDSALLTPAEKRPAQSNRLQNDVSKGATHADAPQIGQSGFAIARNRGETALCPAAPTGKLAFAIAIETAKDQLGVVRIIL